MFEQAIASYLKENFPLPLMNEQEIQQLSWCVRSKIQTPEKDVVKNLDDFIEVRRCATRLYCLALLREGASGYEKFIAAQKELSDKTPLTREQYLELSLDFASLSPLEIETLRVSTIISSVTLSAQAKEKADAALGTGKYSGDSVEFLADTFDDFEAAKKIYPLVAILSEKHPKKKEQEILKQSLQAAFSHRQHYRHMLYTEGNDNMYNNFIASVRSGKLDTKGFKFWACHWRINITGFRGHLNSNGSIYLTSETFRAMRALEECLAKVFSSNCLTAKDILNDYLDKRAGFLKLERFKLEDVPRRLLAHIASMLRLYRPKEGDILAGSITFIPKAILAKLSHVYFDCGDKSEPTPTYAPALFENILDFCAKEYRGAESNNKFVRALSIFNAIVIGVPFYLRAIEAYRAKRATKALSQTLPLSFRDTAYVKKIVELCGVLPLNKEFDILSFVTPEVDDKAMVSFTKIPAKEAQIEISAPSPALLNAYPAASSVTSPQSAKLEDLTAKSANQLRM